jgi:hypothetical protein
MTGCVDIIANRYENVISATVYTSAISANGASHPVGHKAELDKLRVSLGARGYEGFLSPMQLHGYMAPFRSPFGGDSCNQGFSTFASGYFRPHIRVVVDLTTASQSLNVPSSRHILGEGKCLSRRQ